LEAIWNLVAQQKHLPRFTIMAQQGEPQGWVGFLSASGSRKDRRENVGLLFTFWWAIWKVRNDAIFRGLLRSPNHLSRVIIEEIDLYLAAIAMN
jgi:hypothetical protein